METKPNLIKTVWGAFLLQEDAYNAMRDDAQRFRRALILVIAVGVLVGVTGACGRLTEWAFSPDLNMIQQIVRKHLAQMPWYTEASSSIEFVTQFDRWYNLIWNIVKAMAPGPGALASIITTPLSLLIVWPVYGLLAHVAARSVGGKGSLGQTLGCTALAVAPQALNLIMILPFVSVAGIEVWTLMCNFMALRSAHGLTTWRALAATLLPLIVIVFILALFACGGIVIAGSLLASRVGGAQ